MIAGALGATGATGAIGALGSCGKPATAATPAIGAVDVGGVGIFGIPAIVLVVGTPFTFAVLGFVDHGRCWSSRISRIYRGNRCSNRDVLKVWANLGIDIWITGSKFFSRLRRVGVLYAVVTCLLDDHDLEPLVLVFLNPNRARDLVFISIAIDCLPSTLLVDIETLSSRFETSRGWPWTKLTPELADALLPADEPLPAEAPLPDVLLKVRPPSPPTLTVALDELGAVSEAAPTASMGLPSNGSRRLYFACRFRAAVAFLRKPQWQERRHSHATYCT